MIYCKLRKTGKSSEHFGKCVVCDKHASEVYHLTYHEPFIDEEGYKHESIPMIPSKHGHKECLEPIQNKYKCNICYGDGLTTIYGTEIYETCYQCNGINGRLTKE